MYQRQYVAHVPDTRRCRFIVHTADLSALRSYPNETLKSMTTALIYDPIFLEHLTPENHPERPERLKKAIEELQAMNWLEREGLFLLEPRAATEDELATVHERAYIHKVKAAAHKVAHEQATSG